MPVTVIALEATMGLYSIHNEQVDIPEGSVFVGTEEVKPSELWCKGNEEWDICIWLWQDKVGKSCKYIDDTPQNDCSDASINIDKEEKFCNLKFYSGFSKANHEGSWECRLSK